MPKHHHDYNLDKDTPEGIRQLMELDTNTVRNSKNGLPAGDRLLDEPDTDETDETAEPMYGSGVDRAMPGDMHGKGPGDTQRTD